VWKSLWPDPKSEPDEETQSEMRTEARCSGEERANPETESQLRLKRRAPQREPKRGDTNCYCCCCCCVSVSCGYVDVDVDGKRQAAREMARRARRRPAVVVAALRAQCCVTRCPAEAVGNTNVRSLRIRQIHCTQLGAKNTGCLSYGYFATRVFS